MSKSRTLFDPGKILEAAENGLTYLFVKFEDFVEHKLPGIAKYKAPNRRIDPEEKRRRKENRELAKSQDTFMEANSKEKLRNLAEKQRQIAERMQELDNLEHEESQEADLDRD